MPLSSTETTTGALGAVTGGADARYIATMLVAVDV